MNEDKDDRRTYEISDTKKRIEGRMKSIDVNSGTPKVLLQRRPVLCTDYLAYRALSLLSTNWDVGCGVVGDERYRGWQDPA